MGSIGKHPRHHLDDGARLLNDWQTAHDVDRRADDTTDGTAVDGTAYHSPAPDECAEHDRHADDLTAHG